MIRLSQKTLWKKKRAPHKSLVKAPDIPVLFYVVYLYLSLWINWNNSCEKFSASFNQWMSQVNILILAGIQRIEEIVWSLPLNEHEDT